MSRIAAARGVLAPHRYPQEVLTRAFVDVLEPDDSLRRAISAVHEATGVRARNTALPVERYATLDGFGEANDVFIDVGLELATEVVLRALEDAGLAPSEVDLIVATSVTGIAVPSLDARLAHRVGLRPDVKRLPLFGLGCVAGAAGMARAHDHLAGHPGDVVVLLSVELCSLTVQRDDRSMANVVASGLFGDGAAAVVIVGDDRACDGPAVVSSASHLYPDSEQVMGWEVGGSGFRIVLSAEVPGLVTAYLGDDVRRMLDAHGLAVADVATWICHPGGPKVLLALEQSLDLPPHALERTWRSLERMGNLSSASVLHVLAEVLSDAGDDRPAAGAAGVMVAVGPGFCSEVVLLRW